ncbi:DUF695 domain-containing protein [Bradyrhizobium sp. HKCCYLS20291]|uniref:DUF695 domain-containing protein n=1 Tax=Bradyrhizobium sp. HKCCYLS20291 TaxID=3420766 RepID=UPI003EBA7BD9
MARGKVAGHMGGLPSDDQYVLVEFRQRDLPGFANVNSYLKGVQAKDELNWHLSMLLLCEGLGQYRLPSDDEQALLFRFEDEVHNELLQADGVRFLARVTHDGRRELIWRLANPDAANAALQRILNTREHPREFDFRIDYDPLWQKAKWYLEAVQSS